MLIDIAQAVGGYLHDVFVGTADWGILVGYIAQALFAMRFVVQWIASERAGRSVVPTAFWVFSIGGGLMLLGYALYRKDPGVHHRAGFWCLRVFAQSAICLARQRHRGCSLTNLRSATAGGRGHGRKSAFKIGDKIVRIFKANMETHRRSARRPLCGGPVFGAIKQNSQAFEAAP